MQSLQQSRLATPPNDARLRGEVDPVWALLPRIGQARFSRLIDLEGVLKLGSGRGEDLATFSAYEGPFVRGGDAWTKEGRCNGLRLDLHLLSRLLPNRPNRRNT